MRSQHENNLTKKSERISISLLELEKEETKINGVEYDFQLSKKDKKDSESITFSDNNSLLGKV